MCSALSYPLGSLKNELYLSPSFGLLLHEEDQEHYLNNKTSSNINYQINNEDGHLCSLKLSSLTLYHSKSLTYHLDFRSNQINCNSFQLTLFMSEIRLSDQVPLIEDKIILKVQKYIHNLSYLTDCLPLPTNIYCSFASPFNKVSIISLTLVFSFSLSLPNSLLFFHYIALSLIQLFLYLSLFLYLLSFDSMSNIYFYFIFID